MKRRSLFMLLALLAALLTASFSALGEDTGSYTDVAVLSTTDMHGKCWLPTC